MAREVKPDFDFARMRCVSGGTAVEDPVKSTKEQDSSET